MGDPPSGRDLIEPHRSRLSPSHPAYHDILRAHAAALARHDDTYTDPASGLSVLTAEYLLARGHCCESSCRHCPYVE